jgi:hypothetical protein
MPLLTAMAEFTRMSAVDADTELREMRKLLLDRLASQERLKHPTAVTQRRIHALNRALQSLAAEKPTQGKLLEMLPTAAERPRID